MGRGFERLRVGALAVGAVSTALAAGLAKKATAALTPTGFDVATGFASWNDLGNSNSFPVGTGGTADAYGISDATHTPSTKSDAFDGVMMHALNGYPYVDADGQVDLTGTTVTSGGQTSAVRQN